MTDRPTLERLRAITFDLDFTLWDLEGVIARAEHKQYEFLAQRYPKVCEHYTVESLHQLRELIAEREAGLRHNVTELRKAVLREAAQRCGYDEAMVAAAFDVFLDARHEVQLYDDAIPLLEALRGRYVLGVITNGNADVGRMGLREHFDFVLSPMEIGAAKPDRVIFEAACHRAGVESHEAMHVGDEPHSDVAGAADHGMLAVWLNRSRQRWPQDLPGREYLEVSSLRELLDLLNGEAV
jgi:HAD superfamily hydrolase (TIGR01549 family)